MKERPILFNAEMILAVLDVRNSQARRVIKLQPVEGPPVWAERLQRWWGWIGPEPLTKAWRCPYGTAGDRLWVREAWCPVVDPFTGGAATGIGYAADKTWRGGGGIGKFKNGWTCYNWEKPDAWRFRRSIHMPRWASRIDLDVTGVRVERVQDISEEDAKAEGCSDIPYRLAGDGNPTISECVNGRMARWRFRELWDSINAAPKPVYDRDDEGRKIITGYVSYPWEAIEEVREHHGNPWLVHGNPWVWVVDFRRATA